MLRINWQFVLSLCLSLGLLSCANSQRDYQKEHKDFMSLAARAKEEFKGPAYKDWLNRKLQEKQSHLQALAGWQDREERIHGQHEMIDSSSSASGSASGGAGPSVHDFKARNSAQQMHRYSEQKKLLEREIFYLKSQLSALESEG